MPVTIVSGHQNTVRMAEKCGAGWYRYAPDKHCHQFETSGGSNRGATSACPPGMHIGQEGEYCWPNKGGFCMAHQAYMSIKGIKQGQFKGQSTGLRRNGKWIEILAFSYAGQVPYDANSGQASGKRQHKPITITKEWGAASPQLLQACWKNEVLSEVVIEVVGPSHQTGGHEKVAETITLTNAVIAAHRPHVGAARQSHVDTQSGRILTDFDFVFQKITVTNLSASKSANDDWLVG